MKLTIIGQLPDLNTYTKANRSNRYSGGNLKKIATELVSCQCQGSISGAFTIGFHWTFSSKRKDPDNIVGIGMKFILDGLQKGGVIKNDSCRFLKGIDYITWDFGKTDQVVIELTNVTE